MTARGAPTGSSTPGPVAPPEQEGHPDTDTGCNEDQPLRDEPVAEGQRPHVLPRGAQRTRKRREDRGAGPGNAPRFCPQLASPALHALRAAEHTRLWVPELGPRSPAAGSCSGTRCPVSRANSLCKHRPRVHVALSPTSWQLRDWGRRRGGLRAEALLTPLSLRLGLFGAGVPGPWFSDTSLFRRFVPWAGPWIPAHRGP